MSTGDNKPGLRDIRSLRERLGMLNKGGEGEQPAKADAPQPSEPFAESNEIQQTEQSAPQPASPQPAAPAKPSAPAAPSGFGQFDVFSKRETPSQPVESSLSVAPADAAESGLEAFANPFQVGDYRQASAPAVMSAEEQAELQAYEKQSRGVSDDCFGLSQAPLGSSRRHRRHAYKREPRASIRKCEHRYQRTYQRQRSERRWRPSSNCKRWSTA